MELKIYLTPSELYTAIVKDSYTHIRIYQADTEEGAYVEVTDATTRVSLQLGISSYSYYSSAIDKFYKYALGNDSGVGTQSAAFESQPGNPDKIGYSFGNYSAPTGTFGEVLTYDDIKHVYLWGIDLVSQDANYSIWDENRTRFIVESSTKDFEKFLGIDIIRRKFKTAPVAGTDVKVDFWMEGDTSIYTDEEYPYDFVPEYWENYGFLPLRHKPIISVSSVKLVGPTTVQLINLLDWKRINKETGQIHFYPTNQAIYGPPMGVYGSLLLYRMARYPQGLYVDYEAGFENSDKIPSDLRDIIGKWTAIKLLNIIGDGILPGFSSQSVSLDGLSESFSSTQSATSAFFGARLMQYMKEVTEWLQRNRYKYGGVPIGFIGGM